MLSCVAAVVSAYKDGGNIVKQIKAKRAAKRAPAPTESLELSLQRGPPAVEEAKDQGIERYGPRYAYSRDRECEASRDWFNLLTIQSSHCCGGSSRHPYPSPRNAAQASLVSPRG